MNVAGCRRRAFHPLARQCCFTSRWRARARTRNAVRHTPAHVSVARSLSRCLLVCTPAYRHRCFRVAAYAPSRFFCLTAHARRRLQRLGEPEGSTMCQAPRVCLTGYNGSVLLRSEPRSWLDRACRNDPIPATVGAGSSGRRGDVRCVNGK
jgi:hypothetical protein